MPNVIYFSNKRGAPQAYFSIFRSIRGIEYICRFTTRLHQTMSKEPPASEGLHNGARSQEKRSANKNSLQLQNPHNLSPQLRQQILSAARILARQQNCDKMPSSIYVKSKNVDDNGPVQSIDENAFKRPSASVDKHSVLDIVIDRPLMPILGDNPTPSPPPSETPNQSETKNLNREVRGTPALLNMKRSRKLFFRRLSKLEPRPDYQSSNDEDLSSALSSAMIEEIPLSSLLDECMIEDDHLSRARSVPSAGGPGVGQDQSQQDSPVSPCFSGSTISSLSLRGFEEGRKSKKEHHDDGEYSSFSDTAGSTEEGSTAKSLFLTWLDSTLDVLSSGASLCASHSACVAPSTSDDKNSREMRGPF